MNILPLIHRELNLGIERLSEIALSMREPMIAEILKPNNKKTIFLKNKNGIVLYSMTITNNDGKLFFSKFKTVFPEIVSYKIIAKGYER